MDYDTLAPIIKSATRAVQSSGDQETGRRIARLLERSARTLRLTYGPEIRRREALCR